MKVIVAGMLASVLLLGLIVTGLRYHLDGQLERQRMKLLQSPDSETVAVEQLPVCFQEYAELSSRSVPEAAVAVRLRQRGEILLEGVSEWRPFQAEQLISLRAPAFIWVARGALLRNSHLQYARLDDDSARVSVDVDGQTASVDLQADRFGRPVKVFTRARIRDLGAVALPTPWGGTFGDWPGEDGVLLPRFGEVAWYSAGGAQPYFRGEIVQRQFRRSILYA